MNLVIISFPAQNNHDIPAKTSQRRHSAQQHCVTAFQRSVQPAPGQDATHHGQQLITLDFNLTELFQQRRQLMRCPLPQRARAL